MKKLKLIISILIVCLSFLTAFAFIGCGDQSTGETDNKPSKVIYYDFSVSDTEVTMEIDQVYTIVAAYGKAEIVFESSDNTIVSVSSNGQLLAKKCGVAYITITAKDADKQMVAKVTVTEKSIYAIEFNKSDVESVVLVNANVNLSVITTKNGFEYTDTITWSIEGDASSITLIPNGNVCTFRSSVIGQFIVKAISCAGATATYTIVVQNIK